VISEPSPIPRYLFASINKYGQVYFLSKAYPTFSCTHLLSNSVAIRLLLKSGITQRITLPTVNTVILLGDRISTELLTTIERVMPKAQRIAVGMLLTEVGGVPVLSDKTTNLIKSIGKTLEGFQVDVKPVDKLVGANGQRIGELRVRALEKTKFLGYGPKFDSCAEWVETG
jgi:hypothetical protein